MDVWYFLILEHFVILFYKEPHKPHTILGKKNNNRKIILIFSLKYDMPHYIYVFYNVKTVNVFLIKIFV